MTIKYYECHVTVEPVFDEKLELLNKIAGHKRHRFQVADLLMKKRSDETEVRSDKDSFCTSRALPDDLALLTSRMDSFIVSLQENGFKVWRKKIEAVIIDERFPK